MNVIDDTVRLNNAWREMWRTLADERPAFIEIRNHLLGTLLSEEPDDDEIRAYLLDLGQSMTNLIEAIDRLDIAKKPPYLMRRE